MGSLWASISFWGRGFSHNTLRLHLECLVEKGLVMKGRCPRRVLEDPGTATSYLLDSSARSLSSFRTVHRGLSLTLSRLRHFCRFERWILQKDQWSMQTPKLPTNPKGE
jgi:hypothetical protein